MCVYVCICVCMYMYVCVCICIMCVCVYVYVYGSVCVCLSVDSNWFNNENINEKYNVFNYFNISLVSSSILLLTLFSERS